MTTRLQEKAIKIGMVGALKRGRQTTSLILHHNLEPQYVAQLVKTLQMSLTGASLTIAPPSDDSATLASSEAHVDRLQAENRALEEKVKALQAQIDAQTSAIPAEGTRWMTLPEATKIIGKSYSTLHRAHVDGRLVTRIIGGTKKDQIMCDPDTYRGKVATKAS